MSNKIFELRRTKGNYEVKKPKCNIYKRFYSKTRVAKTILCLSWVLMDELFTSQICYFCCIGSTEMMKRISLN